VVFVLDTQHVGDHMNTNSVSELLRRASMAETLSLRRRTAGDLAGADAYWACGKKLRGEAELLKATRRAQVES
jgi:hypothetical protein